jgi:putative ABC transport system permease protein
MKYFPLVWHGLWRKPGRTWLAFVQIAVAFVLFGVLQGFDASVQRMIAETDADMLTVQSRGGSFDLPVAYFGRLARLAGVRAVNHETYADGKYQNSPKDLLVVATLPQQWERTTASDVNISPGAVEALQKSRTGAIVGVTFMERYGWKLGQRIPLQLNVDRMDGSKDWTFDIVGVVETKDPAIRAERSDFMIINYEYLDEARFDRKGRVTQFFVKVNDPKQAATIADEIDALFGNSSDETRTRSKRELAQSQFQAIGDLSSITRSISAAVLFSLLFSIAALLMQGVSERTTDLAVLKTVGFQDWAVVALLLCESLLLCLFAAAVGMGVAEWLLWVSSGRIPLDARLYLPAAVVMLGLALALILALSSAILPARRTLKLQIAEALAGR